MLLCLEEGEQVRVDLVLVCRGVEWRWTISILSIRAAVKGEEDAMRTVKADVADREFLKELLVYVAMAQ